jgi:predicted secreted hydrolase
MSNLKKYTALFGVFYCFLTPLLFGLEWIQPPLKTSEGYPVPQPDTLPQLPSAHGAHPAYAIEWWYWVGHLHTLDQKREFGFQGTVFRSAGAPDQAVEVSEAIFGLDQLYLVHVGLSDFATNRYLHSERAYRSGWQVQCSETQLDIQIGVISAQQVAEDGSFELQLRYPNQVRLLLHCQPVKPLINFGERGLSRKGRDPSAVSLYWTYTRLKITGTWFDGQQSQAVEGLAWMDHEISSSQLGSDLAGWDWTAIQLDDGRELKAYRLRTNDGASDPWSAVYWIDVEGSYRSVYADKFDWEELAYWTSPKSGVRYPNSVLITAHDPANNELQQFHLVPRMQQQEFIGNAADNPYWEGACWVYDEAGMRIGKAYLELAGYGGDIGKLIH